MADNSLIEWTNSTWNMVTGCTRISPGCDNCYIPRTAAFRIQHRSFDRDGIGATTGVLLHPKRLDLPLRWAKPRRIFVNSLSDLFHEAVPDEFIAQVFAVMGLARRHTFQLLTKRHGRMRSLLTRPDFREAVAEHGSDLIGSRPWRRGQIEVAGWTCTPTGTGDTLWSPPWPLPNVWVGVSVEDQKRANLRIPALLDTPAAVRWLSCEPLLGPVNLYHWIQRDDPDGECEACGTEEWTGQSAGGHPKVHYCVDGECTTAGGPDCPMAGEETGDWCPGPVKPYPRPDWVVVGGESGPGARPMHPAWARSLRDQCTAAGVPYFFKQWGAFRPGGDPGRPADWVTPSGEIELAGTPYTIPMARVGKHAAGRELDGRTHDEYPQAVA